MLTTKMIGQKIADARKKTSLSQSQLAERLFISPQAVGKWERGESMPDITTFDRLAEILGVDLNYFSESFQSVYPEPEPGDSPDQQPGKQPSGKQKNKLSWNMSRGNWVDADFSGLKNLHEKFSASNLQRCKFIGSDLSGLLLKSNNVASCDFSNSDISNSHIQSSNLNKNIFRNCSLKETEFSRSNINVCDFSGASLAGAKFSESLLYGCDYTGVDLTGAAFTSGGLTGVTDKSGDSEDNTISKAVWNRTSFKNMQIADLVFTGTFEDCYFENCVFSRVTFRNATLISTFFKNNRKMGKIRFIDCKTDQLTYEFLKNGKADLTGITV